jgi:thiol-disulfide isomerase/thioredoxin
MRLAAVALALASLAWAQEGRVREEKEFLDRKMTEAGASGIDLVHALEDFLDRFPDSAQRPQVEGALLKAALEAGDNRRIAQYGEKALERSRNDLATREKVAQALLASGERPDAQRALAHARALREQLTALRANQPDDTRKQLRLREETDPRLAEALRLEARAVGFLGDPKRAEALARQACETFPSAACARETGHWIAAQDRPAEAAAWYAEAMLFPSGDEAEREADRQHMTGLFERSSGSPEDLGRLMLEAYGRTRDRLEAYRDSLRALDPNAFAADPFEFRLSALEGEPLELATLRGRILVMDFWATWCAPCRAIYPHWVAVQREFADTPQVAFLSVNTDEDRSLVEPFITRYQWDRRIYFEDGLSRRLRVRAIPTTLIFGDDGRLFSRLVNVAPEEYAARLKERIERALAEAAR